MIPTTASADTPPPWIEQQVLCFDLGVAKEIEVSGKMLSRQEARQAAARIETACRRTYRHLKFAPRQRANMTGTDRFELTKELLKASRNLPRK